jgi:hypothetical protein
LLDNKQKANLAISLSLKISPIIQIWKNSMNWEQLLSLKRQGDTNDYVLKQDDTRLGFEVIMIVLFSRQLLEVYKIKPIIPLSKDFVHATHSLEVSVVGKVSRKTCR